jgi:prephenate dehydrogenase
MKIAIIGLGLIGGSLAKEFRVQGHQVFGIDTNGNHAKQALDLALVEKMISLAEIKTMDVVVLAIPVDILPQVTLTVLDIIANNTLVFDVGSTKEAVCKAIANHSKRANFVAVHPIAGTEFSGPKAAHLGLFSHKVNIICEQEKTAGDKLEKLLDLLKPLAMRTVYIDNAAQHDKHIAYVSHLSHISSFMLGKTVLEIEKNENNIFDMAGSGFESTVRLAKSSPKTWTPIFMQNKRHVLSALEEYIANLQLFKKHLENNAPTDIYQIMEATNHIKTILNKDSK